MKSHRINYVVALFATVILASCNSNVVYSEYYSFKDNMWPASEKATFNIGVTDTLSLHDINLMVRHADTYPYSNIFLFVTSSYPDGRVISDTMEVILAGKDGRWKGSGAGDIFDLKVPVKKNVRLPQSGKYTFEFQQGMRIDPLPLIMDFGLEIKKVSRD